MKKLLYLLLCCCLTGLSLSSCKNKKQVLDAPEDLISRNKMVNIIADAYLIESTIHLTPDSIPKREITQQYYKELFQRYNITRDQFVRSLNYYVSEQSSAEKLLMEASALVTEKHQANGDDIAFEPGDVPIFNFSNDTTSPMNNMQATDTGEAI